MTLPDPLPFAGADQAAFNTCCLEKVGIGGDLIEALWEVALDQCFTGNIACRHRGLRWVDYDVAAWIFAVRFAAQAKILDGVVDDLALEGVHRLKFD